MNITTDLVLQIDSITENSHKNRHSYFQLQYFVVGKEPTIQAKIQSCKDELLERKKALLSYDVAINELYDQKRLYEINIKNVKNCKEDLSEEEGIQIRQLCRKIEFCKSQIDDINSKKDDKAEEANFLIGLYDKLCEIEKPKDWDSIEVQAEYWNAKLTQDLQMSLMLGQNPSVEVFKTIFSLPDKSPIKVSTKQLVEEAKLKKLAESKQKA